MALSAIATCSVSFCHTDIGSLREAHLAGSTLPVYLWQGTFPILERCSSFSAALLCSKNFRHSKADFLTRLARFELRPTSAIILPMMPMQSKWRRKNRNSSISRYSRTRTQSSALRTTFRSPSARRHAHGGVARLIFCRNRRWWLKPVQLVAETCLNPVIRLMHAERDRSRRRVA